jgi:hypothetical protein
MKRLSLVILALALGFSLAACGAEETVQDAVRDAISGESASTDADSGTKDTEEPEPKPEPEPSESEQPSESGGIPEGQAMASLIGWMMDGTFSYDFTIKTEGPDGNTEGSGSMAMDGDDMAMTMEMTVEGQAVKSRTIKKGDTMYVVDDVNRMIMQMPVEMNMTEGMMTDYSGIVKTGEGTGEIDGKTLPYEEYAESETGATVRYYLEGGQVYGLESDYEGYKSVMIIANPSNRAPAGAFDLPEGYTDFGGGSVGAAEYDLPEDFELPEGIELPEGVTLPEGFTLP